MGGISLVKVKQSHLMMGSTTDQGAISIIITAVDRYNGVAVRRVELIFKTNCNRESAFQKLFLQFKPIK